jgi:hypothetical protein
MNPLALKLAIIEYDYVRDLTFGRIVPKGMRLL